MLNESDIIRSLRGASGASPNVVGIGDDAAVLPLSATESYVVSKDILVENQHFRLSTTDAASLAHKSLHVNLSDIAAMGAQPLFVLLGIALPPTLPDAWVKEFCAGFTAACQQQAVQLIGGDTTASDRDLFISVTVIGKADTKHLKFRRGAKAGDVICVAGALGEAHAGLMALEKNAVGLDAVKAKSTRPSAKNAEGIWLGRQTGVTAMMDVSDGLYVDLTRLLEASQVGAVVEVQALKPSLQLVEAYSHLKLDVRECMFVGGEDYALLLTINAVVYETVVRDFEQQFGYPLTKIGVVTEGSKLELRDGGKAVPFTSRPFSHFGEL